MFAGTLAQPARDAWAGAQSAAGAMTQAPRASVADLFKATAAMVHRTAWRITGRSEDAEDVLQTVFLHVVRTPPSPWPESPEAYVHRAAVNTSLDILRRRRRSGETQVDDNLAALDGNESDVHARMEEERLALRLRQALPLLSPLEVEVFSLRFFEDRSNAEIAEMLGKTANHVGVTLHAARKKLREALVASLAPEGDQAP